MKPENLEPLLLDRALGELSPATAELLEEHLARDPAASQQAAAFTAALLAAREVVAVPATTSLRPLALDRLRREEWQTRWRSHLGELAKLAACVALGLVLGRSSRPVHPAAEAGATRPAPVTVALVDVPGPESRFWSMASLLAEHRMQAARPDRRELGYSLLWKSPLKRPSVEEKP